MLRLLLLLSFLLSPWPDPALAALQLGPDITHLAAGNEARYYDETAPVMTPDQAAAARHLFVAGDSPERQRKAAMHWVRLSVANPGTGSGKWLLALGIPDAEYLAAYHIRNGTLQPLARMEPGASYSDRPVRERLLALPFELAPAEQGELLLRYRTHAGTPLSLEMVSAGHFQQQLALGNLYNGAVLGLLLALALFALLQYLSAGRTAYLAYAGMAMLMAIFLAQFEGYNFAYLWPDQGFWNQSAPAILATGIQAAHALFAMTLFEMRHRHVALHRIYLVFLALLAPGLGLYLGLGWSWPMLAISLLYVPLAIAVGVHFLRRATDAAGFYLVGTITYTLFTNLLFGLGVYGVDLGVSPFVFPKIGYVCEALFFAMALARQVQGLRRQVEDGLRQRLAEAEQLARAESEKHQALLAAQQRQLRLASTGHDLSQPLASIRFALAALRLRGGDENATRHIDQALDYTESLLRGLVDDARREHAEGHGMLWLDSVLEAARQRHQKAAGSKGLSLRLRTAGHRLSASERVLSRLLDNLLGNAVRYTQRGGVLLATRQRPEGIEILVIDTGPGFDTARQRQLFAPFQQGGTLDEERQGHGLGLHIVQTLCEQSGYRLTVRSRPGRGSRFGILIPFPA